MTPRTYVRAQGAVLLVGLLLLAVVGVPALTIGLSAALALLLALLVVAYHRAVSVSHLATSNERQAYDRLVLQTMAVVLVVGAAAGVAGAVLSDPLLDLEDGRIRAIIEAAVCATAAVLAGSLVDWWWVLPRISGQLGLRPCRAPARQQRAQRRFSWEETTRYWYLNRIVAAVVVIAAGAVVVLNVLRVILGDGAGTTALAGAGGVLALLIGAYRQHLPWAVMELLNPHARVGDTVLADGHDAWCVDVSLEGVKYIDMAEHAARWSGRLSDSADEAVIFEPKFDGSVALTEARRIRHRSIQRPCPPGVCTGANWYCIENPRRYEKPD